MVEQIRSETFVPFPEPLPLWLQSLESGHDSQTKETIIPFGKMWIGTANYGKIATNQDLADNIRIPENGTLRNLTDEEKAYVTNFIETSTGISTRYTSPQEVAGIRTQETVIDEAGSLGARLLHKTIIESGMIPDHIIVSNLDLPIALNQAVKDHSILLPKTVTDESIRAACAGGLLGIIKAMVDPELQGKTVAILSIEPTGHLQDDNHYTQEHAAIPAIFTDMYSVVILRPEDFECLDFQIQVIPGGGIEVKTSYDEEVTLERDEIPAWLTDHIQFVEEDGVPSVFRINSKGIFLDLHPPENGMTATMNGKETGIHFSRYGAEFIHTFLQKNVDRFTSFIYNHQPSKAVIRKLNKILHIEKFYPENAIAFDLPEMNTGNGTSAVTVRHLQHIVTTQQPEPTDNYIGITLGIGSIFAAIKMRQKAA